MAKGRQINFRINESGVKEHRCPACMEWLIYDERSFAPSHRNQDGLEVYCRRCTTALRRCQRFFGTTSLHELAAQGIDWRDYRPELSLRRDNRLKVIK